MVEGVTQIFGALACFSFVWIAVEKPVRVEAGEFRRQLINLFVEPYFAGTIVVSLMVDQVRIYNQRMEVRVLEGVSLKERIDHPAVGFEFRI